MDSNNHVDSWEGDITSRGPGGPILFISAMRHFIISNYVTTNRHRFTGYHGVIFILKINPHFINIEQLVILAYDNYFYHVHSSFEIQPRHPYFTSQYDMYNIVFIIL